MINSDDIDIRKAQPEDAAELAAIHKITWLATYPNKEYGISKDDIADDSVLHLVAKVGGKIVGHSKTENKNYGPNELKSIYVLPEYHGKGVAIILAEHSLRWLGDLKDVSVRVAKYNLKAISFYKKLGFKIASKVGLGQESAAATLPNGKNIPEILMIRPKRIRAT